jgi:hypothetical protein
VQSEKVARALSNIPEDKRAEVLDDAARFHSKDGKRPTAAAIIKAAAAAEIVQEPLDDNGKVVPEAARRIWDRRGEAKDMLGKLRAVKRAVNELSNTDVMWVEVSLQGVIGDLASAISRFGSAIPAYVCPYCEGTGVDCDKNCKCCKRRGVISKFMWDHAVPKEMKG